MSAAPLLGDARLTALAAALPGLGLCGVLLSGRAGHGRDAMLAAIAALAEPGRPPLRLPPGSLPGDLADGLDLAATLAGGAPVRRAGLVARARDRALVVPGADRLDRALVGPLVAALDDRASDLRLVLIDDSLPDEDGAPAALVERMAAILDTNALDRALGPDDTVFGETPDRGEIARRWHAVAVPDDATRHLTLAAIALGIESLRAPLQALSLARLSAAVAGRSQVGEDDLLAALRLSLGPRATRVPAPQDEAPEDQTAEAEATPPPEPAQEADTARQADNDDRPLEDRILEAAAAAIPPHLLAQLQTAGAARQQAAAAGRAGALQKARQRGRIVGARPGHLRERLHLLETLRAAAPWQVLRRRHAPPDAADRLQIRRDDIRIARFKQKAGTTTIFVVDASGSAAQDRLAEAKGAVELMLADCYVRRDQVAVVAFRGRGASVLLPPTRSLHRAKKELSGLPGGGGTPLAAGLQLAGSMAQDLKRRGQAPALVVLTDGRANVDLAGMGGRQQAEADATSAAKVIRAERIPAILIDASQRPEPRAAAIAGAMGATYLPLPRAGAGAVATALKAAPLSGSGR
jgi:magnesium chelatase subunit D